jgi:hypothetical protein
MSKKKEELIESLVAMEKLAYENGKYLIFFNNSTD